MSKTKDFEEDETRVRMHADLERQFAELLGDADERAELVKALRVPEGIEPKAHAELLAGIYAEILRRTGLDKADPHEVGLVASPEGLLALVAGTLPGDNPLAKLARPGASE